MNFVRLIGEKEPVWVNLDYVVKMERMFEERYTYRPTALLMVGGDEIIVEETPEQIMAHISGSKVIA